MILKTLLVSFIVNLFLTILKFLYSIIFSSSTLLADAVHCLSDMMTDIVSIVGGKLSLKKADEKHPFGHGKLEYVTSIILSLFLITMGFTIIINSFNKKPSINSIFPMIIIVITIIIKLFLSSYLLKRGKKFNSSILTSNGTESRYDAYSSTLAFVFICISYFGKYNKLFLYADIIGSFIISLFTIKIGIELFLKNTRAVIGEVETNEEIINEIKGLISNEKIYKLSKLIVIKYGTYYKIILNLKIDGNKKLKELYKLEKEIKNKLKEKSYIKYVTVNMKPL